MSVIENYGEYIIRAPTSNYENVLFILELLGEEEERASHEVVS
jgi:hypothetical protein